jgi:hypothetical protein
MVMEEYREPEYDGYGQPVYEYVLDGLGGVVEVPRYEVKSRPLMVKTKIPYYEVSRFPLILRKNVSDFNGVLGKSDVEVIKDFQFESNKLLTKANKKLMKAGSYITKPKELDFKINNDDFNVLNVDTPEQINRIKTLDLRFDIQSELNAVMFYYERAKSVLGITDSFQGKPDSTAQSGKAKQIQTQQASGRIASKVVMKNAAYAELFEVMFKFMLAYCDEPRKYAARGNNGGEILFDRYAFLEQDPFGNWDYNGEYTFSVDDTAVMLNDRAFMLEEIRNNYGMGAFGQPGSPEATKKYWEMLDSIGYPKAKSMVEYWGNLAGAQMQGMPQMAEAGMPQIPEGMEDMSGGIPEDMPEDASYLQELEGVDLGGY